MGIGLLAGVLWALDTVVLSKALDLYSAILIAPIVAAFLHDLFSFIDLTLVLGPKNCFRSLKAKKRNWIMLASILGGPLGMSSYVLAIYFMGPSYTAAFSSLYPAFGLVLSALLFHEPIQKKQIVGMIIALAAVCGLSLSATGPMISLPLGILCALFCMVCWGSEEIIAQFGMRDGSLGSNYALWIRQGTSATIYALLIMNLIDGWPIALTFFENGSLLFVFLAALCGSLSYLCYYHALHHIGASKAMPLNITYVAWSLLFSFLLLKTVPSFLEIILGIFVLIGAILASS